MNVGATTIPPVMLGLNPYPKLFLYSRTSSSNVPLIWPYCLSVWLPRIMGFLAMDTTRGTGILSEFLHPTYTLNVIFLLLVIIVPFFSIPSLPYEIIPNNCCAFLLQFLFFFFKKIHFLKIK